MNHGKCSTFSSQHKHCQAEIFFRIRFLFFSAGGPAGKLCYCYYYPTTWPEDNKSTNECRPKITLHYSLFLPSSRSAFYFTTTAVWMSIFGFLFVFFTFHNLSLSLCVQCPSTLLCHSFLLPSNFLLTMEQPAVMVLVVIAAL